MRIRTSVSLVVFTCLLAPSGASAQTPAVAVPAAPATAAGAVDGPANVAEFIVRGTAYGAGSDQARFMRYRDLRDGGTLDLLRFTQATDTRWYTVQADHVGYRDQRFAFGFNDYGSVKASFEYNQIPLFFSQDTRTLYTIADATPNTLRLAAGVQSGQQNNTVPYASLDGLAQPFDLRLMRRVAAFKSTYAATQALDLDIAIRSTTKSGNQPWAGTFGFSDAVDLPVPVQTRTTDLGLAAEWAGPQGSARLGYDGSFFRNDLSTIVWDNPLRATDSPTLGPSQGRMSLWPDSSLNAVSASGLLNLPVRSRATAYV